MQHSDRLLDRERLLRSIKQALRESPVTVLLGARQTGKTTLAHMLSGARRNVHFFDLETSADRAALANAELTLSSLRGLIMIDEVQRMPDLFTVLRPLSDRSPPPARFLLLGSASPGLVQGVSESLAGRAQFIPVPGFSLEEVGHDKLGSLWLRGGFPRSWLARSEAASLRWRDSFITTFLERDIPQLGIRVPAETIRRFWTMLCHLHGQLWNASELARSLGTTEKTARRYLDTLAGAHVARVLPPWHENVGKRQRKSPKVYVRDSGLLHALLGIEKMSDLQSHPKYGASWEGFALEQTLMLHGEKTTFFWGTQRGAELDLLMLRQGKRYGFEFKCQDAPTMTKSLRISLEDLKLARAFVVYPGTGKYALHEKVEALPLQGMHPSMFR